MSTKADAAPVRVMIFGEEYQIRTDLGEEYTLECAKYVDDAIQEAHVGGHITEPHRAAILAALKITDELFRARREAEELTDTVQDRIGELVSRLESVTSSGANGKGSAELALDV
ncbi:MAG: cell division protein ZapA [Gemmatimonadetes bacterium]|nr:cell division protein ZapA [Gemmatimonadota bacterium]